MCIVGSDSDIIPVFFMSVVHSCIKMWVVAETAIKCVRWAIAHTGAFYIYENIKKIFLVFRFFLKN